MIVVFGSINLDLVARVRALPVAGETIAAQSFTTGPGGKGANQALAARRAGADVAMFGAVGRDAFATPALSLIRSAGIATVGVLEADAPTGIALIHVDDAGENAITLVPGANAHTRATQVADEMLRPTTTLMLQFEVDAAQSLALATRAKARGARVVLNAAPARTLDDAWFSVLDVLVVNAVEATTIARGLALPSEPRAFAEALAARRDFTSVVTLGERGALAATPIATYVVPPLPVDVVDTVGAGDAFVGALAAALDRGRPIDEALAAGAAAGSLACTRRGAQSSLPDAAAIEEGASVLRSNTTITQRA